MSDGRGPTGGGPPAEVQHVRHADPHPFPLEVEDRLLASVDGYIAKGVELQAWWRETRRRGSFEQRFELGRTYDEPDTSFGFFDTAPVNGEPTPVMGNFQCMFYDRPKVPPEKEAAGTEWIRRQLREFVLHYFMRVSDFRAPEGFAESWTPPTSELFTAVSWCSKPQDSLRGFGFQQLYYKTRDGEVGAFPEAERYAIVDLRELGRRYEWIILRVRIFNFNLVSQPLGAGTPSLSVPLQEESLLVVAPQFICNEENPGPGVLGRYGFGYSFIKNPMPRLLAYGPGEFDAALELIDFEVLEDGRVQVPMVFVANQPTRIVNLTLDPVSLAFAGASLATFGLFNRLLEPLRQTAETLPVPRLQVDPVFAYIDLAALATGGLSATDLCITREQLYKQFLVQHFEEHYNTIDGSLHVWREVADWLDTAALPGWVRTGRVT